ncbi:MAG: right-handed parallel beta-helix repeat-containing protein [Nitrospirae bacterium]|nr:right-handed parallel beta-helix repeat-containing protein [Nitrospirota bacterium]
MSRIFLKVLLIFFFAGVPLTATAGVITSDTVWRDEVLISEDIVVPEGITLTIMPGTIIRIASSESTKTDPEYLSPLTEITVRGILRAEGKKELPVIFRPYGGNESERWAGVIIDGGTAVLSSCVVQGGDAGVYVINGLVDIIGSTLRKNRYGLIAQGPGVNVRIENSQVNENVYGVFLLRGANISSRNNVIEGNIKKDMYSSALKNYKSSAKEYKPGEKGKNRVYGDEVILGNTVWQGRVEVNGLVRVPEEGRLIIMPGTVVEFRRKDTNNDGIGENGLMIQGVIIAKGTGESPIIFRSAEKQNRMGDWDAINIMNSDGVQNLIEYCQIEDAYRGLHFHFSNVAVRVSVLRNNYRGIQFQESNAAITGTYIYGNKNGLQARDSEIILADNYIYNNYSGANVFRANIIARGNRIMNNLREGLRVREGLPVAEENLIDGNRYGLMASDAVYGKFSRNIISNNLESGISLKGTDNIEVSENFIQGNGFNGINIQDSRAVIKGNHISGNGERGMGIISFDGIITENNIIRNGIYAIDLEGGMNISAPRNWWGGAVPEDTIYDGKDDPDRGRVEYKEAGKGPILYSWPMKDIITDVTWDGVLGIHNTVTVSPGLTLTIAPGAKVIFSEGAGLKINGKIIAAGQRDARIIFTSLKKEGASDWDEILLDHATGSLFSNCEFEYATWGIHSHFTNLLVTDCSFARSYGGLRFRSGPVEIIHSIFEGNHIGVRAYRGNASITENVITKNDIGIFVREKGGGVAIHKNNILANTDYNIRNGDFNNEDVDASNNWWGSGNPSDGIFDENREPGIGRVIYEPYAKEPFKTGE